MTQVTSRAATLAAPQASLREERVLRVRAATFSRRALAVAIDAIILLGLVASVIGLTALLLGIRMPAPHELGPDLLITGILDRDPLVLGALGLLVGLSAIYQLCLGGVFGQTFGLRVCGLRIISSRGTLPGPLRGLLRFLAICVSISPMGLGWLWCLFDRERRALHDHLAGTYVILDP